MQRSRSLVAAVALAVALAVAGPGCATKAQTGALIGAAGGAAAGAAVGAAAGNTLMGAILGAAVGGAAGAIIGDYMDRQAAEMERDLENARIERVGEGIKITFDSGILFAVDRWDLTPEAQGNLSELARILNKYEDTNILIEGHTDATGSEEHNQALSERRAATVAAFLASREVASPRFTMVGYGEMQPIASNDTAEGRRLNRRVDVAVMANDKLKGTAERQARG